MTSGSDAPGEPHSSRLPAIRPSYMCASPYAPLRPSSVDPALAAHSSVRKPEASQA